MKTTCSVSFPIMGQVMMIAGILILSASLLGFLIHPYFFFMNMFIGFMLILYSTTGICPMAFMLSKLPCNKK